MMIERLTSQIEQLDGQLRHAASKSVNILLTTRNWLIGFYLIEYEHSGKDRAKYGKALTENLAKRLNTKGLSARNLWLFRQFHLASPQILQAPIPLPSKSTQLVENQSGEILHSVIAELLTNQAMMSQAVRKISAFRTQHSELAAGALRDPLLPQLISGDLQIEQQNEEGLK